MKTLEIIQLVATWNVGPFVLLWFSNHWNVEILVRNKICRNITSCKIINKTQAGKTFSGLASLRYHKSVCFRQMTMIMLTLNSLFGLTMGLLILGNYSCIGYLEGGHFSLVLTEKLGFVKVFRLFISLQQLITIVAIRTWSKIYYGAFFPK